MVVTLATQVGHTCGLMVTKEAVMGHLVGPDELVDIGDPADAVTQDEHSYYHTGHTRQTDLEQSYKLPRYFISTKRNFCIWSDLPGLDRLAPAQLRHTQAVLPGQVGYSQPRHLSFL